MSEVETLIIWLLVGLGFAGLLFISWKIADNDMKARRRKRGIDKDRNE